MGTDLPTPGEQQKRLLALLHRIGGGEHIFKATNDSVAAQEEFQETARLLIDAAQHGLVTFQAPPKKQYRSARFPYDLILVEGLTSEGAALLHAPPQSPPPTSQPPKASSCSSRVPPGPKKGAPGSQRPPAPRGWIWLRDAEEKYGIPRSTLHDWKNKLPEDACEVDADTNQVRVKVSALETLLRKKRRLE